jgi:hypothetical protein
MPLRSSLILLRALAGRSVCVASCDSRSASLASAAAISASLVASACSSSGNGVDSPMPSDAAVGAGADPWFNRLRSFSVSAGAVCIASANDAAAAWAAFVFCSWA